MRQMHDLIEEYEEQDKQIDREVGRARSPLAHRTLVRKRNCAVGAAATNPRSVPEARSAARKAAAQATATPCDPERRPRRWSGSRIAISSRRSYPRPDRRGLGRGSAAPMGWHRTDRGERRPPAPVSTGGGAATDRGATIPAAPANVSKDEARGGAYHRFCARSELFALLEASQTPSSD